MKDFLGNQVLVGDIISYAVRRSSTMKVTIARVIEVNEGSLKVRSVTTGPGAKWRNKKTGRLQTEVYYYIVTLRSDKYITKIRNEDIPDDIYNALYFGGF